MMIKADLETACFGIFESVSVFKSMSMIKTGLETENFAIFEFVPVRFDPFRSIWLI